MFFNNIFQFWKGYVILYLKGHDIERFFNICRRRGIRLWGIQRPENTEAVLCMELADFRKIRPVAYKTKTKVRIQKKRGVPMLLYKYRKRYFLFLGAVLLICFLAVMSQFVWSIEVEGLDDVDRQQVLAAAEYAGVRIGAWKGGLKDGQAMKDIILNRVPDISWTWVYLKGTKAVIRVEEKILPPVLLDKSVPCDVIARRDGLVKKITAKNGEPLVKTGEAVLAGDVIIAGTLADEEAGTYRLVHAMGAVEASTWHEKTGEYKLYYETRRPTGEKKTYRTLDLFSQKINLFRKNSIPYAEYDTIKDKKELALGKDGYLGIGMESVTYAEVDVVREPIAKDTALEIAQSELEAQIAKELLPGAVRVSSDLRHEQIDSETIRVTLTMEFVEQIGTENPIGNY